MADPVVTFLRHLLRSLALVLLTYNPSGWSYASWLATTDRAPASLVLLVGLLLLYGLWHLVRQGHGSLGTANLLACFVRVRAMLWAGTDLHLINLSPTDTWLVLIALATTRAIGASWPDWRRQSRLRFYQQQTARANRRFDRPTPPHSKK